MTDSTTSLDRLHDLVPPPELPWWPLAPGWHVVLGIALLLGLVLAIRTWKRWRANAYRRAALRELATMKSAPEIAKLLRRTALAFAPRETIAAQSGPGWIDWLSAQGVENMPAEIAAQLTTGIYDSSKGKGSLEALRAYAAHWIARHRAGSIEGTSPHPN